MYCKWQVNFKNCIKNFIGGIDTNAEKQKQEKKNLTLNNIPIITILCWGNFIVKSPRRALRDFKKSPFS